MADWRTMLPNGDHDEPLIDDLPSSSHNWRDEAFEVYGIVLAQIERGDIEAAKNELAEAARRIEQNAPLSWRRLLDALELLSDAAMLPAGDSSGDAPKALRSDEKASGEAPEGGS